VSPSTRDLVASTLVDVVAGEGGGDVGGGLVERLDRLTGGASRETWSASIDGRAVVAQRQAAESEHDLRVEAALLRAAEAAGVPAPRVLDCVEGPDGVVTLVTDFVVGETIARKILRDDAYSAARDVLTAQLAEALASIHAIPASAAAGLEPVDIVVAYRDRLDDLGEPHPAFELAFRWLDEHRSLAGAAGANDMTHVVHGDFRLGNVIVDTDGLAAVIDWELAHLGNPMEDLGWLCVPAWRFGSPLPAAGVGTREQLLDAYNAAAGTAHTLDELRWWEVCGILRWGIICMSQADRHLSGTTRSHELAAIGRRVCENEHDIFLALDGRW
jgi:aminoglycoside phosphotransferase (APT) family kinase protein